MNAAVVVAGGSGERFGVPGGKQLALLDGTPVVSHALRAFDAADSVDVVILVTHPERVEEFREAAVVPLGETKVSDIIAGGETRRESVLAGIRAVPRGTRLVAIHDGARPLITPRVIDDAFGWLADDPEAVGVAVGHPAVDTLHEVDSGRVIRATPDRGRLWQAQTPQVFRLDALESALAADGSDGTDDAGLVAACYGRVVMLTGPRENIKITFPGDLAYAEWVLGTLAAEGNG